MNFSKGMDRVAVVAAGVGAIAAFVFTFKHSRGFEFLDGPLAWVQLLILLSVAAAAPYGLVRLITWVITWVCQGFHVISTLRPHYQMEVGRQREAQSAQHRAAKLHVNPYPASRVQRVQRDHVLTTRSLRQRWRQATGQVGVRAGTPELLPAGSSQSYPRLGGTPLR